MKLLIGIILSLLVCGCGVGPAEINTANSVCENNGGLKIIYMYNKAYDVHCENGAIFRYQYTEDK